MKCLALNKKNDIFLNESKSIAVNTDKHAIATVSLCNVRTLLGEVYFDKTIGIPYFDLVANRKINLDIFRSYIQNMISIVKGFISFQSINFSLENEKLSYEISMNTTYGEVKLNE